MIANVKEKQKEYKKKREEERKEKTLAFFEQLKEIILNDVDYIESCVVANNDYIFFKIWNPVVSAPMKEDYHILQKLIKEIDLGEVRLLFDDIFKEQYRELRVRCCWEFVDKDVEKNNIEEEEEEWSLWTFLYSWLK